MNFLNCNPLELATKIVLLNNDRVRYLVSNMSKFKTLVHANQICSQIDNYRKIAVFASLCPLSNDRSKILELCNHGINDSYNELDRLKREALRDEVIERCVDMRR